MFESFQRHANRDELRGEWATYRFDIDGVGSWHVTIADGDVTIEQSEAEADCVVWASEDTLLRIARGEQNPTTAFLTGLLHVEGDLVLAARLDKFRL